MGKGKTIAVDFDGTLAEDRFPEIGEPIFANIAALLAEQAYGAKIILWTCRTGRKLGEAVEWCGKQGIRFDAVNGNLPENIEKYGSDSRKVLADEYWDDRAASIPRGKGNRHET